VDIVNNNSSNDTATDEKLWTTDEVMEFTGWGRTYVSRLCTQGRLPYIPGKPHKFVPSEVKNAIRQMQIGGRFKKGGATMKAVVTVCPFNNTENLAEIAGEGTSEAEQAIEIQLQNIKTTHPELKMQLDLLDDLHLKAITEAQNNTLREIICPNCNTRSICTPEQK
jgi:hypothetical protein